MVKPGYTIATGAGVWMVDLCLQLLSSAFPEKLKPHPNIIAGIGILGLLLILFGAYQWFAHRKPSEAATIPSNSGQYAGRDAGVQIGSLIGDEALKAILNAHRQTASSPPPPAPVPRIAFLQARRIWVTVDGQRWRQGEPGSKVGAVIEIANVLAKEGEPESPLVGGIAAQLFFCDETGSKSRRVDRAFWLDHYENAINLDSGESKAVFLGLYGNDSWLYCWNTRKDRPQFSQGNVRRAIHVAESLSLPITDCGILPLTIQNSLIVEIIIFKVSSGTQIASTAYVIRRIDAAEQFSIEEIK
jgi:hypothetical protein